MKCSGNDTNPRQLSGNLKSKVPHLVAYKLLVLIVEDEFLIRLNAAEMVRELGFEVLEAVDADHAIVLLETTADIAIVFTDIQMPGSVDGLGLLAIIRNRWPPIALVVTSGHLPSRIFPPEPASWPSPICNGNSASIFML